MTHRTLKERFYRHYVVGLGLVLVFVLTGCKVEEAEGMNQDTPVFKAVCGGPAITIDLEGDKFFFPEAGTLTKVEFDSASSDHTDPKTLYYSDEKDDKKENPQVQGAPEGTQFSLVQDSMKISFTPPPPPFKGQITLKLSSSHGETGGGKANSSHGIIHIQVSCGDEPDPSCTCETDGDCLPNQVCRKCKCVTPACGDGAVDPGEECESQTDCNPGAICTDCKCVTASCGNGTIDQGEECEASADCGEGMTCFGCMCEDSVCGDGSITGDEDCEMHASCDPGEICSDCVCAAGSLGQACNPGAMAWDEELNKSAQVEIDPYTCACYVSNMGYHVLGFQYLPDQGVITAQTDSSMSVNQTEPDIGWGEIEEVPFGTPVTYWISTHLVDNPELALDTIKVTVTADVEGLSAAAIECAN